MEKYFTITFDGQEPTNDHIIIEKKEKAIYEISIEFKKHNIILWTVYKDGEIFEYVKTCTVTKESNGAHSWVWFSS